MQTTARTFKHTVGQGHGLPVSTSATCLACVCRIHCYEYPPSFYRFGGYHGKEVRPRCVIYAFGKAIIVNHPVDVEVFNEDPPVLVNDPSGLLVGEVITLKPDALVNTSNNLATLGSLGSAFIFLGELALRFSKFLLFLFEKSGILNRVSIGERSESVDTDIYTDSVVLGRKNLRLDFASKRHVPLARGRAEDSGGLWDAIKRTVLNHLDVAYLGDKKPSIFHRTSRRDLGECKAVVASFSLESWITRLFSSSLYSSKESLKSEVYTKSDILKTLSIADGEGRTFFLEAWKCRGLIVITGRFACLLKAILTLRKKVVIQPANFLKLVIEHRCLLVRWVYAVSVIFNHRCIMNIYKQMSITT